MSTQSCPFCETPRSANIGHCTACVAALGEPGVASWIIGADPACELVVAHPRVSSRHARLRFAAGRFTVEDLGSTNGVYVAGARLAPRTPTAVAPFGPVTLGQAVPLPWPHRPAAAPAAARAPSATAPRPPGPATMMSELHTEVGRLREESRAQREELRRKRHWLVPALIGLAGAGLAAGVVALVVTREDSPAKSAPPPPGPPPQPPVAAPGPDAIRKKIFNDNHRAVVLIQHTYTARGQIVEVEGTGFCVDPGGLIVTNRHVAMPWTEDHVAGKTVDLEVFFSGETQGLSGQVLRAHTDEDLDVALITVGGSGHPTVVGLDADPAAVQVGDEAVIIGFPLGSDLPFEAGATPSLTAGVISKKLTKIFQYDATSHHGSSGSPVFDTNGKVVAVNFAGAAAAGGGGGDQAAGINYGIPIRYVLELMQR